MHTEIYCTTLDALDHVNAIRAIHQAYSQLYALTEIAEENGFDNEPALDALEACLREAGYRGL